MNILDENVRSDQCELLRARRIAVRQIGHNLGEKGLSDEHIIPLLLSLHRPTLFTTDRDFYSRTLCHSRYCLVQLAVRKTEVASYSRRLLRHPLFNTQAKRMGCVIRVTPTGITVWRLYSETEGRVAWE